MVSGMGAPLSASQGVNSQRGRGALVELDIMIRNARDENFYLFTVWKPRRIVLESAATLKYSPSTLVVTLVTLASLPVVAGGKQRIGFAR